MRFDLDPNIQWDTNEGPGSVGINERGGLFAMTRILPTGDGGALPFGPSPTRPGAVRAAAVFASNSDMNGVINPATAQFGVDGSNGALTAECMVDINAAAWATLTAAGDAPRFCPIVSMLASGDVVWTLGVGSWVVQDANAGLRRNVYAVSAISLRGVVSAGAVLSTSIGLALTARPGRFVHLCASRKDTGGGNFQHAVWFDGEPGLNAVTEQIIKLGSDPIGVVRIGGAVPQFRLPIGLADIVRFTGAVDEMRITAATRRPASIALFPNRIAQGDRVIPWPNY